MKLHGENILLNIDGEFKISVVYATDFLQGGKSTRSLKIAAILIHQHPNLRNIVLNESTDRPTINIEEIEKVNSLKFFAKN